MKRADVVKSMSRAGSLQSHISQDTVGTGSAIRDVGRTLFSEGSSHFDGGEGLENDLASAAVDPEIPDSLFQLDEQTEQQPDDENERKSPIASIEIRTFKLLEQIRETARTSDAQDGSITTVCQLSQPIPGPRCSNPPDVLIVPVCG